jgi:hypothetical protein
VFKSTGDANLMGEVTELYNIPAQSYTEAQGEWSIQGNGMLCRTVQGELTYSVDMPENDMLLVNLFGGADRPESLRNEYRMALSVDGELVGERILRSGGEVRSTDYGMRYTASLNVPEDGDYTFTVDSDDGSQLCIDGQLVVNNDGLHSAKTVSKTTPLSGGLHQLTVTYFQRGGGSSLQVRIAGPSFAERELSVQDLSSDILWQYYEGAWSSLPDFDALKVLKSGRCDRIDLAVRNEPTLGRASWLLPWLQAGTHEITVRWINGYSRRHVFLEKLIVQSVAGEDANNND